MEKFLFVIVLAKLVVLSHEQDPTISVAVMESGTPIEDMPYILTCTVSGHQALMATVTYQWLNNSNFITSSQSSNQYTFNPVDRYDNGTYTCEATVNSAQLNSSIIKNGSIMIQVTILLPAQPSIAILRRRTTSISLSWSHPSSGGRVERYDVWYTASERDCNTQLPSGSASTGTQRSYTISTGLEENSEVVVNITATNIRGSNSATILTSTTTNSPSGVVGNLRSNSVTSSSITVTWNELSCVERNGVITGYRIDYGITAFDNARTQTGRSFTATGLRPLTTYMFRVAARNSNGMGPYSSTISRQTRVSPAVTLWHDGSTVSNQSIVSLEEIRGGSGLFCLTNYDTGSSRVGSWYFPDGTEVPQSGTNQFVRNRGRSFVALSSSGFPAPPSGLYRCVIRNYYNQQISLFAAVYPNGQGVPQIVSPLQYNAANRTITCISSGGPATTVLWTRDNNVLPPSIQEQQLIDTETATYHNLLTITGRYIRDYTGRFRCAVRNSRGTSSSQSLVLDFIVISGNRLFQFGEIATITCSAPVPTLSIQWVNVSAGNEIISRSSNLTFMILSSVENTVYRCDIRDAFFATHFQNITIQVGDQNRPRIPEAIHAMSTQTNITITWSFTTILDSRNETFTVMYGTTPGELSMTSPPVLSMPSVQQYSVQLVSLHPGTRYYYQIHSTNRFINVYENLERSIKTMDARSTAVRNVISQIQNNTALVLSWQAPETTNGDILHYLVQVTTHADGVLLEERNVTNTHFTISSVLTSGVPYNFSVIPVNLAGQGVVKTETFFYGELTPDIEVVNVMVDRTSPTTMVVSWRPLTLSEARGFVTFYSIAYTPTPNSRRRQASQDTMYVTVSADSLSVTIQGLAEDLAYSVTVAAATRAGIGVWSSAIIVRVNEDHTIAYIISGVAVLGILIIATASASAVVLVVIVKKRKLRSAQSKKEHDANIYEEPAHEVKGLNSRARRNEADKEEWFILKKCPAYFTVANVAAIREDADRKAGYECVTPRALPSRDTPSPVEDVRDSPKPVLPPRDTIEPSKHSASDYENVILARKLYEGTLL